MSSSIIHVVAVLAVCAGVALSMATMDEFKKFKALHKKQYASAEQEQLAFRNFENNAAAIEQLREANPLATFGFSKFSDVTQDDFRARLARSSANAPRPSASAVFHPSSKTTAATKLPSELNWVARGAVTPVQDQGDCGSDWAFAAVANIEGVNFVKNQHLTPLSVEELLSCSTSNGCDGGATEAAFSWLLEKQGGNIMTAESWPYNNGVATNCTFVGKTVGATITAYEAINPSESNVQVYTATYGPIAVGVDASTWQFYTGGVITNCTYQQIDHMVTVVGYNDVASPPYWILKNSWGSAFGINGYVWIEKGINACGIKEMPITAFAQKYD